MFGVLLHIQRSTLTDSGSCSDIWNETATLRFTGAPLSSESFLYSVNFITTGMSLAAEVNHSICCSDVAVHMGMLNSQKVLL